MSIETAQENATSTTSAATPMKPFEKFVTAVFAATTFSFGLGAGTDIYQSIKHGQNMSGAAAFAFSCVRSSESTSTILRPAAAVLASGAQLSAGVTDTLFGPSAGVRTLKCD